MSLRPKAQAPGWALGLVAVLFLGAALAALTVLGDRGAPDGVAPEDDGLVVERTDLGPGTIELTVRNTGAEPARVAQAFVNDVYVDVVGANEPIGRLATDTLRLGYPWQDGQPYLVSLLMADGSVIEHEVSGAADDPGAGPAHLGSMALLGACVGVGAVLVGVLVVPALRRRPAADRMLLALTVGLLAFPVFEGTVTSFELAEQAGAVFGGAALAVLGAAVAFLLLTGVDHGPARRQRPALVVVGGLGLLNLCAGLAIGSAYTVGEPGLGTALVMGFALHNITESGEVTSVLAGERTGPTRLLALALVTGAPAIAGAVLGAAVDSTELSAFLLGVGVGAAVQAITRLALRLRERAGGLPPSALFGVLAGVLITFLTGLLVTP